MYTYTKNNEKKIPDYFEHHGINLTKVLIIIIQSI